jgi:hypothetical protein
MTRLSAAPPSDRASDAAAKFFSQTPGCTISGWCPVTISGRSSISARPTPLEAR